MGFNNMFANMIPGQQPTQGVNNPMSGLNFSGIRNMASQFQNQVPRPATPISPKAFSNQGTIAGLYGQANPGTFTRTVQTPLAQMVDPSLAMGIDPTNPGVPNAIQNDMAATGFPDYSTPQTPPQNVEQQITPTYDLSNS